MPLASAIEASLRRLRTAGQRGVCHRPRDRHGPLTAAFLGAGMDCHRMRQLFVVVVFQVVGGDLVAGGKPDAFVPAQPGERRVHPVKKWFKVGKL
jgi:hypothetical protein